MEDLFEEAPKGWRGWEERFSMKAMLDRGCSDAVVREAHGFFKRGSEHSASSREGRRLFKLAADLGHPSAQCSLGYGLALSNGDYVTAARYWALAASQGHAESEWQLAQLYDEGRGVVQDKAKAHAMFEIAANQHDNRNAQYLLGRRYVADGDYSTAHRYLFRAVNGHEGQKWGTGMADEEADAHCLMGYCYLKDEGMGKNCREAVSCFQRAADHEHAEAQYELGSCLLTGKGIPLDYAKGFHYCKLAADQGIRDAAWRVGECYTFGRGVTEDNSAATRFLKQAADGGHREAAMLLSSLHDEARTKADAAMAALLLEEEGSRQSQKRGKKKGRVCSTMQSESARRDANDALEKAICSNELETLRQALEQHQQLAAEGILVRARTLRDRLRQKAKKSRKQSDKGEGPSMRSAPQDLPDEFVCPITLTLMTDPVITSDGQTYERKAIEDWLQRNSTSPLTAVELDNKNLIPNVALRSQILSLSSTTAIGES